MSLKATASARLCLGDLSEPVYRALISEANQRGAPAKGSVAVNLDHDCVVIRLESDDISGLRALLTSYIFLAHAAYSVLSSIDKST